MTEDEQRQYDAAMEFVKDQYIRLQRGKGGGDSRAWTRRDRLFGILRMTPEGRVWLNADHSMRLESDA